MTKKRIAILLTTLFIMGAFAGAAIRTSKQQSEIERLEQELLDTQQQLIISNDQLKQIQAYQEREYYMEQENEVDN